MKKIFTTLFALTLGLILSLSVFACDGEQPDQTSESVKPEPIVAVDGVNVGEILKVLDPILDNDYISLEGSLGYETVKSSLNTTEEVPTVKKYSERYFCDYCVKVKRTVKGYDFAMICDFSEYGMQSKPSNENGQNGNEYKPLIVEIYYVDGICVLGSGTSKRDIIYRKQEVKSFNGFINELNAKIANDPATRKAYDAFMAEFKSLSKIVNKNDLKNLDLSVDGDHKDLANGLIDYVITNQNKSLYEVLTTELGITATEEDVKTAVGEVVESLCGDNPSLAVFIERVVDAINELIRSSYDDPSEFEEINVKKLLDDYQKTHEFTVQDLCVLVNMIAGDDVLVAPTEDVSMYEYLYGLLDMITVNDLASLATGKDGITVKEIVLQTLEDVKQITVKQALDTAVKGIWGISDGSSFLEELENDKIKFNAIRWQADVKTDEKSRLCKVMLGFEFSCVAEGLSPDYAESMLAFVSAEISYAAFGDFVIPQEILDSAEEMGGATIGALQ